VSDEADGALEGTYSGGGWTLRLSREWFELRGPSGSYHGPVERVGSLVDLQGSGAEFMASEDSMEAIDSAPGTFPYALKPLDDGAGFELYGGRLRRAIYGGGHVEGECMAILLPQDGAPGG
jgi:hypothetical protein